MSAVSRILVSLLFLTVTVKPLLSQNSSCPPSSCGDIRDIRFPFRLIGDPSSCGYDDLVFALRCQDNRTFLIARSKAYRVIDINYDDFSIRLVDPGVDRANISSCPVHNNDFDDWPRTINANFFDWNVPVVFVECSAPVTTRPDYIQAPLCSNRSTGAAANSSFGYYSYVMVAKIGNIPVTDLEESCSVDRVNWASTRRPMRDNGTLAGLYEGMDYGFEMSWFRVMCGECERTLGFCSLEGNKVSCRHYCREDTPISQLSFGCQFEYYGILVGAYTLFVVPGLLVLRFLIGLPFLIGVVVYKWRRRHQFMDGNTTEV